MNYTIHQGDALTVLRTMPAASVHCIVTSPPYFGLRDYGMAGQIGLEPTLRQYVERLTAVFAECLRVLRPDGTLWLNLGDSYANNASTSLIPRARQGNGEGKLRIPDERQVAARRQQPNRATALRADGLKRKDLLGVPWRVAFALQETGWYLRSEITWCKLAPMPESVSDRPTSATEKLFLLAAGERYYYDAAAVAERSVSDHPAGNGYARDARLSYADGGGARGQARGWEMQPTRNMRNYLVLGPEPTKFARFATMPTRLVEPCILAGTSAAGCCPQCGAPWERVTERQTAGWQPTCICGCAGDVRPGDFDLIATPTGDGHGDPTLHTGRKGLGRPRSEDGGQRPITRYEQRQYAVQLRSSPHRAAMEAEAGPSAFAHYERTDRAGARPIPPDLLEGWIARGWLERVIVPERSPLPPVPCTVLDPFAGSGTTGVVALRTGRAFVGIELNSKYIELAHKRIRATQPALAALA